MITYAVIAQIIIAISIIYVWIFRYDNILNEFKQYGLSDLTRNIVGASKIALSTLIIAGIWYPSLAAIPALLMALLMLAAQYFHFKVKNSLVKRLPSFFLLILSLFVYATYSNLIYL